MSSDFSKLKTTAISEAMHRSFFAAVAAAQPSHFMANALPALPPLFSRFGESGNSTKRRIIIIAAGKAAGGMAQAAEEFYSPDTPLCGCVILPHGQNLPPSTIKSRLTVLQAAHPLPDENSVKAAQTVLNLVQTATADDAVLVLLSGGASSLLGAPMAGLTLAQLREISKRLLNAAADVREINIVRRQLSLVGGGRLAAACSAPLHTLICSDVVGGAPADIASGPCAISLTNSEDALAVLKKYCIAEDFPEICTGLQNGTFALPPAAALAQSVNTIVGDSHAALAAGEKTLQAHGMHTFNWGEQTAAVQTLAENHLHYLKTCIQKNGKNGLASLSCPLAIISGGEGLSAVSENADIKGGKGGRNTAFALHLWQAAPMEFANNLYLLSCDTDGIDGAQTAAGALWTPQHRKTAAALNLSLQHFLDNNNSGAFFEKIDALIHSGQTGANVSDYRILVYANASSG